VFRFTPTQKFDIIVSNLVFHNFGRMRFKACDLLSWTQTGSFIVTGDLFFSPKIDMALLAKEFKILRRIKPKNDGFEQYALLVMLKDSEKAGMD
jgi:hypothetical protein